MPTPLQILDIVTIAIFGLFLLLTVPILKKHTAKKEVPWIWLSGACALRLTSASVGYVAGTPGVHSPTKIEVTAITSSLVPILLVVALTEIVNRILTSIGAGGSVLGVSAEKRSWVNACALIAVIVGVIGGVRAFNTDNADTRRQGQLFGGVATTLMFVQLVLVLGMLGFAGVVVKQQGRGRGRGCSGNRSGVLPEGEWMLLVSALGSVPFLFVRTVFAMCVAWNPNVEVFEFPSDKVSAMAVWIVLGLVMEVGAAGIFVCGGLLVPKIPEGQMRAEEGGEDKEMKVEVQSPKMIDDGLERGFTLDR